MHEYLVFTRNQQMREDAERIREQNRLRREALGERRWSINLKPARDFLTRLVLRPAPKPTRQVKPTRRFS